MIPFVPILQDGESAFAMFANLQTKYDWVLDSLVYDFPQSLIDVLDDALINPALEKRHELELRKARNTPTRHVSDYPSIRNLESGWFDGTSVNSISSLTSVDHSFKKKQLARIESSGFHRNSLGDPTKPGMASFAFGLTNFSPACRRSFNAALCLRRVLRLIMSVRSIHRSPVLPPSIDKRD
jgi:hypothetical protein